MRGWLIGTACTFLGFWALQASAEPAATTATLTKADVESWLDGLVPYSIDRGDIAGGVVVVVKDGQILAEKGFGYADVAKKIPVDPEQTLFRPGSISKLFTATAVFAQTNAQTNAPSPDAARRSGYENSPRATIIHPANVYTSPDENAQRLDVVEPGHECVVLEKSGPWVR